MAIGATMHTFEVELADVDRGVYETLSLRLAQHPSETGAYMVTRLLAYLLEYQEGIEFSDGIAATDEPAVLIRDLTGRLLAWIEVGAPEPERLHQGSKAADRCVVYTHREPSRLLARYVGKKIHQADAIAFHSFDDGFVDELASRLERRNTVTLSRTEGQLYATINGHSVASGIHEHVVGA